MASELAKQHAATWRKSDSWNADDVARVIDAAIRASHAQRTRRENKAWARIDEQSKVLSAEQIRKALRRARRGSK